MTTPRHRPPGQQGSAAVLAVGLVGVLVAVTALVAALGGMVVDQRRVEAAADLAALAGAAAAQRGDDGCAAAGSVARLNTSRVTRCTAARQVVQVRVVRTGRQLFGRRFTVASTARAGPVGVLPPG